MPETINFWTRFLPEDDRGYAVLRNDFEAPCQTHDLQKRPDDSRNNRQHNPLAQGESSAVLVGHFPDFTRRAFCIAAVGIEAEVCSTRGYQDGMGR